MKITSTRNKEKSCPFGTYTVYDLSNGWTVTTEYYESLNFDGVTRLEKKGEKTWHVSQRLDKLPEWVKPFLKKDGINSILHNQAVVA